MDMLTSVSVTPPGISFLKRFGSAGKGSYLYKENQDDYNSLTIPLVSEEKSIKEEYPTSTTSHHQSLGSCPKISTSEFPTPQRQCSFAQSVINGITNLLYN